MKKFFTFFLIYPIWHFSFEAKGQTELQITNPNLNAGNYVARDKVQALPITESFSTTGAIHLYTDPSIITNHDYSGGITDPTQQVSRPFDYSLPVGTTQGAFQVSSNGSLNYNVPIALPPGTNNVVPKLSLVYSSMSKAGILGQGWSISGINSISRVGQSMYSNEQVEGIKFNNSNDWFVFGGDRLIPTSGSNGNPDATYSTEHESYSIFTSKGTQGTGPEWFEVKTKEGLTIEFGNSSDSRLVPSGRSDLTVLSWMINKITDLSGSYITFEYLNLNGEVHISKISYTGNIYAGLDPYNTVNFYYDSRTDQTNSQLSDANTSYIGGGEINSSVILRSVSIKCEDNFFKEYKFKYSFFNTFSYLTEIEEYGSDQNKLNTLAFSYGQDLPGPAQETTNLCSANIIGTMNSGYVVKYIPVDFNGDGAEDLVALYGQIINGVSVVWADFRGRLYDLTYSTPTSMQWQFWDVLRNDGSLGFTKVNNSSFFFPQDFISYDAYPLNKSSAGNIQFEKFDLNLDGKEDLLFTSISSIGVKLFPYISLGDVGYDGVEPSPIIFTSSGSINDHFQMKYLDFNGDSKLDAFVCREDPSNNNLSIGYAVCLDVVTNSTHSLISPSFPLDFSSSFAADIDGDGRSELVNIKGYSTSVNRYVMRYLSDVAQFDCVHDDTEFDYHVLNYDPDPDPNCTDGIYFNLFGDYNGDRITDVLQASKSSTLSWILYYGKGGFEHEASDITAVSGLLDPFVFPCDRFYYSRDLNADGKTDILEFTVNSTSTTMKIYYSTGKSFVTETVVLNFIINKNINDINFADFNGDGTSDILFYNPSIGTWFNTQQQCLFPPQILYFNRGAKSKFLTEVVNGYNLQTKFEYKPLNTGGSFYSQPSSQTEPLVNFNGALYAVSKVTIPDGVGGVLETTYSYEDALVHNSGKGFLGFLKIKMENTGLNLRIEKSYHSSAPFYNLLLGSVKNFKLPNTLLSERTLTYSVTAIPISNISCKVQLTDDNSYDYVADYPVTKHYDYDSYGNMEFQETNINSDLLVTKITNVYTQSIPSLINSSNIWKRRLLEAPISRSISYSYNGYGRLQHEVHDPGEAGSIKIDYSYYNLAVACSTKIVTAPNAVPALQPRTVTYLQYDDYFRFPQQVKNPLNQVTYIDYDARWGKPVTFKDVDQTVTHFTYDGFGNIIKKINPDNQVITTTYECIDPNSLVASYPLPVNTIAYSVKNECAGNPSSLTYYDLFGRMILSETDGLTTTIDKMKQYDYKGNVFKETGNYETGATEQLVTTYNYDYSDPLNLVNSIQTTDGTITTTTSIDYNYSGGNKTVDVESADSKHIIKVADASGQLISCTDHEGHTINYQYYSNGLAKQVAIGNGAPIDQITYDLYGNRTSVSNRNAGTATFEYNAYGQLTKQTNANLNVYQNYIYDQMGKIESMTGAEGTYTYEYVTLGNGINKIKKRSTPNNATTFYSYDILGRVTSVTDNIEGESFVTQHQYNPLGRISKTIYPDNFAVAFQYDPQRGYLTQINNSQTGDLIWQGISTTPNGQYSEYALGNGLNSKIDWDKFGMPSRIYTPSNLAIQDLSLEFNIENGNLANRQDNSKFTQPKDIFSYDNLNRLTNSLTTAVGETDFNIAIQYNSDFGIEEKTDAGTYTYGSSKPDAVRKVTNPDGNISIAQQNIAYTHFNLPSSIIEGNNTLNISYGADMERKKTELIQNGTALYTRYFSNTYEKNISSNLTQQIYYIHSPTGLVAIYILENGIGTMYYVYTDHLGSIVKVTDENANVIAEQSFDAWGRYRDPQTWSSLNARPSNIPEWLYRGYTNHEHLPEFSLVNMNGRIYDPLIGMMLSPDKYVQETDNSKNFNRYSYVLNNPVKYTDPSGQNFEWWYLLVADILTGGAVSTIGTITATTLAATAALATVTTVTTANAVAADPVANWAAGFGQSWLVDGNSFNESLSQGDQRASNTWAIWGGLIEGSSSQVESRMTWELPQTLIGFSVANGYNIAGQVKDVGYFDGATILNCVDIYPGVRGTTFGSYILGVDISFDPFERDGAQDYSEGAKLLQHEYGHYLQSQASGSPYMWFYGFSSANGAIWTETDAELRSRRYFRSQYNVDVGIIYEDFDFENTQPIDTEWFFYLPGAGIFFWLTQ